MKPDPLTLRKRKARRQLARLPFEEKIAALVRMQLMAREFAQSRGRRFNGIVWSSCLRK